MNTIIEKTITQEKRAMPSKMNSLIKLTEIVPSHPALVNPFYKKWTSTRLPIEHIAIFARNYWELTYRFPEVLALLILTMDDIAARVEYTKTLFSEMGNGKPRSVHSVLFSGFCSDLSRYLGRPNYLSTSNLKNHFPCLPETIAIIEGEKKLYRENSSIAAGAQLAMEWQAYTMISQLYDGARNYIDLWPSQDSFHESCEFFYAHIGETEKQHKKQAMKVAYQYSRGKASLRHVEFGFHEHLSLIANFWDGINKAFSENHLQPTSELAY